MHQNLNDKSVKYDSSLVNGLFCHVIETGLQSETLRTKMRPLLAMPNVSDEELMEKINIAASEECERENKLRSHARAKSINQVIAQSSETESYMATLRAVQAELASLRSDFNKKRTRAKARRTKRTLPL